jgi:hypothetical protein
MSNETERPKDEFELQIGKGTLDIDRKLQIDKIYNVAFQVVCTDINQGKTNMGADLYTSKCKIYGAGIIQNEFGIKLPAKDRKSMSKQLRNLIWNYWNKSNKQMEEETHYENTMKKIMDKIYEFT